MRACKTLLLTVAAFGLTAGVVPTKAHADLMWTLEDVTFDDGGTMSGTFVTNDSGILQSWDITTTTGTTLPGETYDSANGSTVFVHHPSGFKILSDDGIQGVGLFSYDTATVDFVAADNPVVLATPSNVVGGNGSGSVEGQTGGDQIDRSVISGEAVLDVPEPVSAALLGTGFAGILVSRRRRS